ncbi:MAG TPA: glycoside hydrolase family 15 protein [Terriglobales bacterium]
MRAAFGLVSVLKMMGRDADAKSLFDRLLSLRNDVGLLAEEYDPRTESQLGNFPQALLHIALINAAFEFTRASGPGYQRSHSRPSKADKRE